MRVDGRLPSARVSVPGGSRHEEPQVGGVQEATRELPIVAVDRAQVGRVHEDEAGYGVLHHFQAPHVDDRVPFQRFGVLGVDGDDGYPGRGPDDRRGRDVLAQEGVEDRGLARTRRALEQIARESADCRRVLAVSHGMTITAILKSIDPKAIEYRSVPNVSVSRLILSDGLWRIGSIGETE